MMVFHLKSRLLSHHGEVPEFELFAGAKHPQTTQIRGFAPVA
jgi:hypothetical protein